MIQPEDLSKFLRRRGWRTQKHRNPDLLVLSGQSSAFESLATIVIPSDGAMLDYPAKLRDAIAMMADLFDERIDSIVDRILHWNRDVLRLRLTSPLSTEQLLPLEVAADVIGKYRDFVAFAAATEAEPRRFFSKLTGVGRDFVEKCLFGHTFVGSFGLTVECPLNLTSEQQLPGLSNERPFRRAVTERIASGYASIEEARRKNDPSIIVNNHTTGFSGNMCEILTDVFEILENRDFAQSVIWSPELPPPERLMAASTPVVLNEDSYELLKQASRELQTVEKPEEDKTIVGRITGLRSDRPPLDTESASAPRTIVVLWEMERRQPMRLHIALSPEQYREACDAHKNGRKIRIVGKPLKEGKFWYLRELRDFQIL